MSWFSERNAKIVQLFDEGQTLEAIAGRFRLMPKTVLFILRGWNRGTGNSRAMSDRRRDEMIRLRESGMVVREVASKVGVSPRWVWKVLKKYRHRSESKL